jgi:hypothetical protein
MSDTAIAFNLAMPLCEVSLKINWTRTFIKREGDVPGKQELYQLLNTFSTIFITFQKHPFISNGTRRGNLVLEGPYNDR